MERLIPRMHALHLAERDGGFWAGCARGDGLRRASGCDTHRRSSGSDYAWGGWLHGAGRGHRCPGAAKLIELLSNSGLHERMSKAARNTALTRFSTDLIIPQYEAYYVQVSEGAGTSARAAVSK